MLQDESTRLSLEQNGLAEKVKENKEKIKLSNQLPYLVGNVVEVLDVVPEENEVRRHVQQTCVQRRRRGRARNLRMLPGRRMALRWTWTLSGRANAWC